MNARIFSLRWKIIALFGVSILLSLISVGALIQIVHQLGMQNRTGVFYRLLKILQTGIGVVPLGAAAGMAFFVLFVFLLSRSSILYLEKISRALQQISLGRLDVEIPPRSADELGELATNINRMAARLRASLEEERNTERSKGDLITGISHDLRTPLTSILGYLELIGREPAPDEAEIRRYAQTALLKSRQLKKLIDALFEYTKVSHGEIKFRPSCIDLKELFAQLAEEFVPTLHAEDMEFRLDAPDSHYAISADGELLVRVFENLLSNAVRHGRRGRIILLELSRDAVWTTAKIINFGDPIPPQELPHVFDRFYRGTGSGEGKDEGTGLGLAIAKTIVILHGGEISARSDASRTEFQVKLKSEH
jgi:signal transduction histidine kinase